MLYVREKPTWNDLIKVFAQRDNNGGVMTKDSQPDNKQARKIKSRGQTPITRENQNQNRNAKKKSIPNNDV